MIWNIGGNMKRIINLVFTLVMTTLFLISCAEPNDSNNNTKTEEQLYLRINFTGTDEPMGAWIWGDFDKSEIAKCTTTIHRVINERAMRRR